MAKLTGAKKAAFLKRMAAGRRKAATRTSKIVKKSMVRKRKPSTTKRKSKKSIPLRRAKQRKTMVKRRSTVRTVARRSSKGIGSSLKTGIIGDVVKGIGAGSLITLVMSRVAPNSSITPLAATGAAFVTGGLIGGAANLILSGGLGQLGGMFGGGATAPIQEFGV